MRILPRDTTLRWTVAAIAGVLLFTAQMQFGSAPADASVDASWQAVLNWGILHGAQWGKDLVFTYGPLGFLTPNAPFNPHLYPVWLGLEICLALISTALAVANIARLPLVAAVAYLLATFVLAIGWSSSALWIMTYPLAFLVLMRTAEQPPRRHDVFIIAGLAAFESLLPLLKFSAFPLWILWMPAGTVVLLLMRKPRLALVFAIASVFAPLIAWLSCGQSLTNLPAFLRWSWLVALYYAGALQSPPDVPTDDAIALLALSAVILVLGVTAWRERRNSARAIAAIVLAAAASLAYRAGTLRADSGHLLIFWSAGAWIGALAAGLWLQTCKRSARNRIIAFVLAIIPLTMLRATATYPRHTYGLLYSGQASIALVEHSIEQILHPGQAYAYRMKRWNETRAKLALPKIEKMIRGQPVDLLSHQQGVLLANDFNYRPRPVFQSYSAYSDALARLNAAFFRSDNAPPWVIMGLSTIDDHYPTADDARALPEILQDYRPVLNEHDFMLFHRERAPVPAPDDVKQAIELAVAIDHPVSIPVFSQNAIFAKLNVKLTLAGKLIALLTREPVLYFTTILRNGETHRYRVPRATAQSGFMLSPVIDGKENYMDWLLGSDARQIAGITVQQTWFLGHPVFRIASPLRLYPFDLARERQLSFALIIERYPGFNLLPDAMSQKPRRWKVDGAQALNFQAPATLSFKVPGGTYAVSAHYGIVPNALNNSACLHAHPDGIGIGISSGNQTPQARAFDYLNPFSDPAHRYAGDFARTIIVQKGEPLNLRISIGPPGSNGACDWAWLRDVRIVPAHH